MDEVKRINIEENLNLLTVDMQAEFNPIGFEGVLCDNCKSKAVLILTPIEGLTELRLCASHIKELRLILEHADI